MSSRHTLVPLFAALPMAIPAVAAADVFYANDFQSGVPGPGWSSNAAVVSHAAFSKYLGRYSMDQGVLLTITAPACGGGTGGSGGSGGSTGGGTTGGGTTGGGTTGGTGSIGGTTGGSGDACQFTLTFDLYPIDSWDGSNATYGTDRFKVFVNGSLLFNETVSNQGPAHSIRNPDVGPTQMGYGAGLDSIYRDLSVVFTAPAESQIKIKFQGQVMQGLIDESWGIDNVRVSMEPVPAPGPAALLGLAGLALARRRR